MYTNNKGRDISYRRAKTKNFTDNLKYQHGMNFLIFSSLLQFRLPSRTDRHRHGAPTPGRYSSVSEKDTASGAESADTHRPQKVKSLDISLRHGNSVLQKKEKIKSKNAERKKTP